MRAASLGSVLVALMGDQVGLAPGGDAHVGRDPKALRTAPTTERERITSISVSTMGAGQVLLALVGHKDLLGSPRLQQHLSGGPVLGRLQHREHKSNTHHESRGEDDKSGTCAA